MDNKKRNRLLAVLFLGVLMAAMDIAIVGPALPAIRDAFRVDDRTVAWVFTTYLLTNLIGTPVMAKLSDRFGRRDVYVADVVLFVIGSIVVASAPTLPLILLGRGIQGFGSGGIFPVASAVIGDTFPPEKRGGALGLIGAVFGLAFLIGPVLGGILLQYGWQMLFWGPLPIAVLLVPLAWRLLPQRAKTISAQADLAGTLTLGAFLLALAWGLNRLDAEHLGSSLRSLEVWPFLVLSLLLLPVLLRTENRAADPIVRPVLFSTRQLRLADLLSFGAGVVEGGTVFIPALLVSAFGVSESKASFMLIPIVLTLAIGSPTFGNLLDKYGSRFVITIGTALLTLGAAWMSFLPLTLASFYISGALVGLGLSALLGAPVRYIMINEAPVDDRAAAQALISLLTKIGQMLTGALIGAVATSLGGGVGGYQAAFRVLTVFSALLFLGAWQLKAQHDERATLAKNEALI
ncbi:MAG: MFS transporter [Anaerolineales bacterium]